MGRSPWHLDHALGGARWASLPLAAALGTLTGIGGVALSRALVRRSDWARALHSELRRGLAGLSPRAVMPLALGSAVGEELLFRGAIQPPLQGYLGTAAGLAVASLLFGLVHVPWNRRLLPWTAMAAVMGLIFGGLYLLTGELLAPIAAHAVINHENLHFILAHDPPPLFPRVDAYPRGALTRGGRRPSAGVTPRT